MMPMPPTTSEIAATLASMIEMVVVTALRASAMASMLYTL